ncbi:MAG TPA: OB-fold domain-containing protein [Acidisphaera sp.]|nr:OB-fold domain-containing protein [Acidisphaera sp.]
MSKRRLVFPGSTGSNPGLSTFWAACEERRLLVPHCRACGRAHWYPRAVCPHCASHELDWREAKGEGVIYSFSAVPRGEPPYVIAYVTLAEGPTMLTNIVGDAATLRIGQTVRLRFVDSDGGPPLPVFAPR